MLARSKFGPRHKNSRRAANAREFPQHLGWLRKRPCLIEGRCGHVCGGKIEAHHHNEGEGGMGLKTFDYDGVPLCSIAHAEVHMGKLTFQAKYKVDLEAEAADFKRHSPHKHLWEAANGED